MSDYSPPVDQLLSLGELREHWIWTDYPAKFGLGAEHVADLIRMATDRDLNEGESDEPEVWAPIHALRALGQLRAEDAIEPLLAMLTSLGDTDDYYPNDLAKVFGLIGPAAIPASTRFLADNAQTESNRMAVAEALEKIGGTHLEARDECVEILTRQLAEYEQRPGDQGVNGIIISSLLELGAVESAPVIEAAFAAGAVDEWIVGDWEEVRYRLGLGPMPSDGRPMVWSPSSGLLSDSRPPRPDLAKLKKKLQKQKKSKAKRHR